MAEIPQVQFNIDDLNEWYKLQAELTRIKNLEMLLRKRIFAVAFPDPREGANKFALPDNYMLTGTHTVNRKLDIGALQAIAQPLQALGVRPDDLVDWEPKLVLSQYRTLTAEQAHLFDQALIIAPGSPSMKITLPPKKGGKDLSPPTVVGAPGPDVPF
jgi:hypothetical protein